MAGFWSNLDPIVSSLRPWNPPLFINGRKGQSCLHWGKIIALDSVGKNLNRWLKVGIMSCQIYRKMLTELASLGWRRRWWVVIQPEWAIWRCREIAEDHLRARFINFMDIRCIKCTYKIAFISCHFRDLKKKINSTKVLFFAKVHFSPPSLNLI
jgi:hypothetical protein